MKEKKFILKTKLILILILVSTFSFSQDIDYAKRIIQKLASPEFKGRGYIENGDKVSADYISKEFQALGLSPINKQSYFQEFNISVNTLPNRVLVKINGNTLQVATDYLVESSCPSINGKFHIINTSRSQIFV